MRYPLHHQDKLKYPQRRVLQQQEAHVLPQHMNGVKIHLFTANEYPIPGGQQRLKHYIHIINGGKETNRINKSDAYKWAKRHHD